MKLNSIVPGSLVDGEGIRYTIFFQGCPHQCDGCVALDTKILTNDNIYKEAHLIEIGDKLLSPQGETIVKNKKYEQQQGYEIELENGEKIIVGEYHKFFINGKEVLSIQDAAKLANVSTRWIINLLDEGKLQGVRHEKRRYVYKDSLDEYIQDRDSK